MLRDSFFKAIKIICSGKQDLNWWSRNIIKWDLLTPVSMSFSNKLLLNDWNWRTLNKGILSPDENKFVYKKSWSWNWKHFETLRLEESTKWRIEDCESTNSLYKNWGKVMKPYSSSHRRYMIYKREWLAWVIQENFKIQNRFAVEKILTKSSICAKPRQTLATWYMEVVWTNWKRFWQSTSYVRFITDA